MSVLVGGAYFILQSGSVPELCLSAYKSGAGAERRLTSPDTPAADVEEKDKNGWRRRRKKRDVRERHGGIKNEKKSKRTFLTRVATQGVLVPPPKCSIHVSLCS